MNESDESSPPDASNADYEPSEANEDEDSSHAGSGNRAEADDDPNLSASALAEDVGLHRRLRQEGLQNLGKWFGGPASFGGPAAGRDIHINNYGTVRRKAMAAGLVDSQLLRRIADEHLAGASYFEANEKLREHHLVVLRGTDGSGKRTTAQHLMMGKASENCIRVVDGAEILGIQDDSWIEDSMRYLADIRETEKLTYVRLTALSAALKDRGSYLVITTSVETDTEAVAEGQFVTDHEPPSGRDVLLHRLQQDAAHGDAAGQLLKEADALDCAATPRAGDELAKLSLDAAKQGQSADALSPAIAKIRRTRARHLLRVGSLKQAERDRTELLYRRAALISLAVFAGLPHADAVEAAESLAARFISIEFSSKRHEIFVPWRQLLLREPDVEVHDSELSGPWGPVRPPQVRFTDPELSAVVLETVWDEFEAVRSPLLAWLRVLAINRYNEPVRVRAAQVAGRLAALDFDHICHRLILSWAESTSIKPREAAATALDAVPPSLDPNAWRLVSEWCEQGTPAQQRTAILALGTGLHGRNPDEILRRLRQIALRNDGRTAQNMGNTVRRSVTELFSGDQPVPVLRALGEWADDGDSRLSSLARRCVLPLAYVTGPSRRPVLLQALASECGILENTSAAFAAALSEPGTREDAWQALGQLAVAVADHPELAGTLGSLLARLVQRSSMTENEARFYLRLWAYQHPELLESAP